MNKGFKVSVTTVDREGNQETFDLRNVTEIHYRYPTLVGESVRVAFESDIHKTGATYDLAGLAQWGDPEKFLLGKQRMIVEFEATLETVIWVSF